MYAVSTRKCLKFCESICDFRTTESMLYICYKVIQPFFECDSVGFEQVTRLRSTQ